MTRKQKEIVSQITDLVRKKMSGDTSGHDWWHVLRVVTMAKRLARLEKANLFIVELGALLHDIADAKFHGGDDIIGSRVAREILNNYDLDEETIDHVCQIVAHVSFKGAKTKNKINTLEGQVVQDADRLDAMGAIGVARAFAYGGHDGREMYNPKHKPVVGRTKKAYYAAKGTSINHFYEKLLLLKGRLNTKSARRIGRERHQFMLKYLKEFYAEWSGKR